MACPPEIAEILLTMLGEGLVRIRAAAWSGRADRAAAEADHLHNVPRLIGEFSPELLAYYWDVERPSYLAQSAADQAACWEPHWARLRPLVEGLREPASAGGPRSTP